MIKKKYINYIMKCQYISERIVIVKLRINNEKINIMGIYAPENCKPEKDREQFHEELHKMIDEISINETVIIMGDYTARLGNEVIPRVKQTFNENIKKDNGELMINFCATNELRINNTYFDHKEQYKYTFKNTRGNRSMIDYVLTNREIHLRHILDVRSLTSPNVGREHNLVMCELRWNIRNTKQCQNKELKQR